MALIDRDTLKKWFVRGAKPLAVQFAAWIDSYWHKSDKIPADSIENLQELLDKKADIEVINNITELVTEAAKALQLERRIALIFETSEMLLVVGEKMKFTKVTGKNISKVEIKPNDSTVTKWVELPLNKDINVDISNCLSTDALIRITRSTIDNISTVYIFAKVVTT